ncbi:LamG domain-containing protein [Pirellulimonas nuda]|uniref:LamG domain-containing protein n=1 Tax=Pirellulimonas nuda TaxID=2528009 RepID=UPI0018D2FEF5|nr:LamG domain-containing protein [Pirellulimonas nuda]
MLLLTDLNGSLASEESARKTTFEGWGHTVTTLWDGASQAAYDSAIAAVDVVYVPYSATPADVSYKLRLTTKGVVHEGLVQFDDEMGWTATDGSSPSSGVLTINIASNSHSITSGFALGNTAVYSSSTGSWIATIPGSLSLGAQALGTRSGTSTPCLAVLDVGAGLANTYSGNGIASGRRVRLPYGGGAFTWSNITTAGKSLAQKAIAWAATGGNPLLLHWKLDEASGTTSTDSSTHARNGSVVGTATWVAGRRNGAIDLNKATKVQTTGLLGNPANFTIACWANTRTSDSSGAELVSIGDHFEILSHYAPYNAPVAAFWNGSSYVVVSASGGNRVGTGWHHYVVTFDDATDLLKIYVDGALVGTTTTTSSISFAGNGSNSVVGANGWNDTTFDHDGPIDDVRVYNYALSTSEIADVYGLVGHWKLNEGAGSTLADSSLKANHASFSTGAPTWVSGIRGYALKFDGTNDAATSAVFDPPSTGAVAFWIRRDSQQSDQERPFGLSGEWEARQETSGVMAFDLGASPYVGQESFQTSAVAPALGQWSHVVAQYDATNDSWQIYLDGTLHLAGTNTADIVKQAAATLSFGARNGSPQRFKGAMEDFRVYNRWLQPDEIAELSGLIGHWKLNETTGTTAGDSSLNARAGVHTNGVVINQGGPYPGAVAADFDGINDRVAIPSVRSDFSTGFSAAMWVRPSAAPAGGQYYAFLDLSNGADNDQVWLGWVNTVGFQLYLTDTKDGSSLKTIEDNHELDVDRWVHCVATVDASGNATLYRDGKVTKSGFYTSLPSNVTRSQVTLGTSAFNDNFPGRLQDVRLYNRRLTPDDVAKLYGLVGQWKLDDTTGATANDSSGMSRHGTMLGSPAKGQSGPKGLLDALAFDGVDDAVMLPPVSDSFSNGVSIALWARPTTTAFNSRFFQLAEWTSKPIELGRNQGTGSLLGLANTGQSLTSSNQIINGVWRHYALTVDRTGWARLYRDGILMVEGQRQLPLAGSRRSNTIGDSQWSGDALFIGRMHDVRLYNRPMSPEEVRTLFYGAFTPGARIISWQEIR